MRSLGSFLIMVLMLLPAGGASAFAGAGHADQAGVDDGLAPARNYYYRVERDVRRYVNRLDHALNLNRRQKRRIRRLLTQCTYDLLEHAPHRRFRAVYPFPRHEGYGHSHRLQRWWAEVDQRIAGHLNRRQTRKFRRLTRNAYTSKHRYDDRYDEYEYGDRDDRRNRRGDRRPRRNGKPY